ncbi:MAG: hypothetical protein A3G29_12025 [Burkholderiales bacterium RIFCSPLOWO2_12_FULL_64_99]|nr:MAG: hypothetical protein A3E52_05690 [Burkholderiales bacterium RIFCSPHIGHO2_12_FULL_63_20]OGB61695.1 MAG: hypothetical protein A3G29_12025 [Burkholderiales bacterium RIFCSPLOWO2_12_FULL_64_99]
MTMSWLKKDPNSIRSPAGLEWRIWKKLPLIFLVGTVVPLLLAGATWFFSPEQPDGARDPAIMRFEFVMIGLVILHWTLVLTVAIGCAIVMLMKGPNYKADSYPMPDSDEPL